MWGELSRLNTIQLLKKLVYKEYEQNKNIIFNHVRMVPNSITKYPVFNYKDGHNNVYAEFEPVLGYIAARLDIHKIYVMECDKFIADKIYEDVMRIYNGYIEESYYI